MAKVIYLHPETPQPRQIKQVIERLKKDDLIVYPTDSGYAFGWAIGNKKAQERVIQLRRTDSKHNFTVMCSNVSQITEFAQVNNTAFKLIKKLAPGPFTFILPATRNLPKWLRNEKRKSVGIRIPDMPIAQALLEELNEPMM
ncbi:MAG: L-threonylcarbamoyladenylate synthase, partial [bacterium]